LARSSHRNRGGDRHAALGVGPLGRVTGAGRVEEHQDIEPAGGGREINIPVSRLIRRRSHAAVAAAALLAALFLSARDCDASALALAGAENVRLVSVDCLVKDGTVSTGYSAIVRDYADDAIIPDVWLPSGLLAKLNFQIKPNKKRNSFILRLQRPSEVLVIPALESLAPDALDLEFQALSADNTQYFNASGVERYTGISFLLPETPGNRGESVLVGGTPKKEARGTEGKSPGGPRTPAAPFNLVWDHITGINPDISSADSLPPADVLSPTWFALSSENGDISNKGSAAYTASAHRNGYQVWALVSNGFKKERTKKFLASERAQDVFIARMLAYAAIYEIDGINIDFEGVANDDAARLTAFVRRMSDAARAMGLVVSIDVMVPSKWSMAYQRKELSEIVDYVAVMTYDEHWRTSPKAGSTASLPWVRAALEKTLADVPASKLLLGIPLYTREWIETKDKTGRVKVSSKTMAMASVDVRQSETSSEPKWLPDVGQNYLQFTEKDGTHKIWIEDGRSIALRMDLVEGNGLAGAAFWRRGFEKPEIWEHATKQQSGR
jgi:hypothetical protein